MVERKALLVGTLPGQSAAEAMRAAVDRLGPHLLQLPDGETGDRRVWIVGLINSFRDHPDLEVASEGDWSDYKHQLNYRVRRGHQLSGEALDLGYLHWYEINRPVFDELDTGLDFQVGIPGDLDMTMFTFGPTRMFGRREAFRSATVRDITAIHAKSPSDVVYQFEWSLRRRFSWPRPGRSVASSPPGWRPGPPPYGRGRA